MTNVKEGQLGHLFFTGASSFLEANENFVQALVGASAHCAIHASEDIFDANGLKLWAGGQPIGERLLDRLSNRRLRKPIELCVYAADPIAAAGIAETIEARVAGSPDLGALFAQALGNVLKVVRTIAPNPTELMLLSVMRHSGRDMMGHAALVSAIALATAGMDDIHPDLTRILTRASLLHDVGELYLPMTLFNSSDARSPAQIREIRSHVLIGAQVAIELARAGPVVGHLIASSHERLDGWGYPRALRAADLSRPAQALSFAEAMAPLLGSGTNGLRRAAVAARLVPGEFAPGMVNWIVRLGTSRPVTLQDGASAAAIGMDLLQIQAVLSRLRPLLKDPEKRETTEVCAAAAGWFKAVDALIDELRRAGIESAISCGMSVEPQDDTEHIELSVLSEEMRYRIRELRIRVELAQADSPGLGSSALVIEVLELLHACERAPARRDSLGARRPAVMSWSRLYSVGVREIDEQHRVLVGLLNRLGAANDGESPGVVVADTLAALVKYVGEHFACEERLMKEHGYADTASHVAAHGELAARVGQLVARQENAAAVSLDELTVFLRQWLIAHILNADMALGVALNAKGVR